MHVIEKKRRDSVFKVKYWLVKGMQQQWSNLKHVALVLPGSQLIFWWGHQTSTTAVGSLSPLSCLKRGIQSSESYSSCNGSLYYLCGLAFVWHLPQKYLKLWSAGHYSLCLISQVSHMFGKNVNRRVFLFYDMELSISLCHKQLCLTVLGTISLPSNWLLESILRGKAKTSVVF